MTIGLACFRSRFFVSMTCVRDQVLTEHFGNFIVNFYIHLKWVDTGSQSHQIIYPRITGPKTKVHIEVWFEELSLDLVRASNKQPVQAPQSLLYSNLP